MNRQIGESAQNPQLIYAKSVLSLMKVRLPYTKAHMLDMRKP